MNFASTVLVALLAIIATPQRPEPDVKGSSDYPLFANRMPDYRISIYKMDRSERSLITGPKRAGRRIVAWSLWKD